MPETVHPVDLHVGKRLKERRAAQNITQTDLGADLGISAQQVQKYENGTNRISASKLFDVARRLGTTVSWFFEGLDDSPTLSFVESITVFQPQALQYERMRDLIAAFKALPDDAAREAAFVFVKSKAGQVI